jgi:amino acid adenylation domain-containing protein
MKILGVSNLDQSTPKSRQSRSTASPSSVDLPPTEARLADVWREVLGAGVHARTIACDDQFFELGGDSITATQVAARVREVFDVDLPIPTVFSAPTLGALAQQITLLTQHRRVFTPPPLEPVSRDQVIPLSFSQERMWFVHQLDPQGSAYNVVGAVRMSGALDVHALQRSLDDLVQRHEALRTTFPVVNGQPAQVIAPLAPTATLPLERVDLRPPFAALSPAAREGEIHRLLDERSAQPFDIEHGPLARFILFQTGAQDYVFLMSMHHIITDAWSMAVLAQDMAKLYEAHTQGQAANLPPLRVQYADYAMWQRQWLTGEPLQAHLSYWRKQLEGVKPLDLITDHARPAVQTYRGALTSAALEHDTLDGLNRLATAEGATSFIVMLAAFQTLLYRYTSQPDIAVCVPIANRDWLQSEQLMGSLVNTLVLRADLGGAPTFLQLLRRVRDMALDAYAHQNIPFAKLVQELNPERDTAHAPFAQVMFNMINVPMPEFKMRGVQSDYIEVDRKASQFDFTCTIVDMPLVQRMTLEFNLDLFEPESMEYMLAHYGVLLRSILANPDESIDRLVMMDEAERQRLLVEWNNTSTDYDREETLHAAFDAQVQRTPNALALRCGSHTLTYRQLDARASQVGRYLQRLGVKPDTLVGVCIARSPDAIVALLGVLKAGCAYAPLDPSYPLERLNYIIQDAAMPVVLAHNGTMSVVAGVQARVVNVDAERAAIERESALTLSVHVPASSAAYIVYTSGSTGKPKGVPGTHVGAINRARWMWRAYPFTAGEAYCQRTSLSWVDAVWEIFGPLLQGVPGVILPDDLVKDPRELVRALAEAHITRITLVPSLLKVLLDTHPDLGQRLPELKVCASGGEALPAPLGHQFVRQMPHTHLLNLYGLSEASGDSTFYEANPAMPIETTPIGKPMDNVQMVVIDAQLQPAPVGVPGELCVGGDGLALGYLNRPELTAQRFMAHPFSRTPGERLYRTGDIARFLPDGNIHYLGRRDDQVKIRGMRVETGEVEAVLKQHPALNDAVVVARKDYSSNVHLIAYVVPRVQSNGRLDLDMDEVRTFAQRQLPAHMVPRTFVPLAALPLTPNGKLDRRALPAWDSGPRREEVQLVAPHNEIERRLLALWQRVLERPEISVSDNFFDLGGHSLLAVKLFAEIEQEFGKVLPLSMLFQAPTLAALAQVLQADTSQAASPLVPIQPKGHLPPFFCVHGIGGGVVGYAPLARHLGEDQPFYGLSAQEGNGDEAGHGHIEMMAARYIKAIQTIQPHGPYYLGGYSYGGTVALEMAQQLREQGNEVALLAMFDHPAPQSGYELPRLSLTFIRGFIGNLSHWWRDYMSIPARERRGRIRRKLMITRAHGENGEVDLRRYVDDVSVLPPQFQELVRKHYQGLEAYHPKPYPGRVTLFRSPRQPLICSFDPHMAWDRLAKDGIDVYAIAGSHRNLLEEPYVPVLADALKEALTRARAAQACGG